ncbi:hypothetical protein NPIL_561721 [Nephila pilipes]|uniref:Uncharacterized protein n=1 Tax=Nephila pilipes TaxID=299642 RepID=A0A8X6QE70_NEPPI|nr:hypothetical protein NPIL_561721 [Nephila pilipes]
MVAILHGFVQYFGIGAACTAKVVAYSKLALSSMQYGLYRSRTTRCQRRPPAAYGVLCMALADDKGFILTGQMFPLRRTAWKVATEGRRWQQKLC